MELSTLQLITIWVIPVLLAVILHEIAHGWVALQFGDSTARQEGRLTLNPINHIDPIGTVILPIIMLLTTNFVFGWAKPVPVNFNRLKKPVRDMALVALAGPTANLLMLVFWAIITQIGWLMPESLGITKFLIYIGNAGIYINIVLMILNLLPILPLDGGRILYSLLPRHLAEPYSKLEPFGFIILVVLLMTNMLGHILTTPLIYIYRLAGGTIMELLIIFGN